jgi:predicted nucleic acid-binding protein
MPFVLDSSVTLAWLLPDENSSAIDALADRLTEAPAVVPSIWYLEVSNALLMSVHRKRLSRSDMSRLLDAATALPIEADPTPIEERLTAIVALAQRHALTTYDAVYLDLAQRRMLPLATLDTRLREAAQKLELESLP